jgi:hypothetical protein
VNEDIVAEAERRFTKPGAVVHELVPGPFHIKALEFYQELGSAIIN